MELTINTRSRKDIVDITEDINDLLDNEKSSEGLCHIFVLHTTAAITTADLDPGTDLDMLDAFEQIIPQLPFRHSHNPDHAPDHILSSIIGPGLTVPFQNNQLLLGTWQRVILVELDGPRERRIIFTVL